MSVLLSSPLRLSPPALVCGLLLLVCIASAPAAQSTGEPARSDYRRYQVIFERNIFNTKRYARMPVNNGERRETTRRAARVDSLALVGTMQYAKGPFAFFDGSSDAYRKALQPEGKIGAFKVIAIGPNYVTLQEGTNQFALRIGKQLRREDQGPWQIADYEPRVAFGSYGGSSRSSGYDSRRSSYDSRRDDNRSETPAFTPPPGFGDTGLPPAMVVVNGESGEPIVIAPQPEGQPGDGPEQPQAGGAPPAGANTTPTRNDEPVDEVTRRLMERRAQELNR